MHGNGDNKMNNTSEMPGTQIQDNIIETEKIIRDAAAVHGDDARIIMRDTAYPLALSYAFTGQKIITVKDLHKCVHLQKELAGGGDDACFKAGIILLLTDEIRQAAQMLNEQTDSAFISDTQIRAWGVPLAFKDFPAIAVITGMGSDAREVVNTVNEYKRQGICMLVIGKIAQQCREAQINIGNMHGIIAIEGENAYMNAVSAIVRFALIFGSICVGNRQELRRYIKTDLPVFINAFGSLNGRDLCLAEGAAALGIPVICDRQSGSAHLIGADNHREMIDKSLHFRNIPANTDRPSLPVAYSVFCENETIDEKECCAQLGDTEENTSFELVLTRKAENVKDRAVTLVGSDISKEACGMSLGIIAEIYGHKMKSEYEAVIEKNIHRWLNAAEGISHTGGKDHIQIKISREAYDRGFRLAHLGEILCARIKSEYAAVAEKCSVTLVTDGKTVKELRTAAAAPKHNIRDAQNADAGAYACTLCKTIAPCGRCIVTAEKPGACERITQHDAKLISEEIDHEVVKKLNKADDSIYSIQTGRQTNFGGFSCLSAVIPKAKGVIVLDDKYAGRTPLGLNYCALAALTDGCFPAPGCMGHAKDFLTSEKYLEPEGGLIRVVWMPKALKESLRVKIDETAYTLYHIARFSDMICDETVTTESEALIDFLVEKNHPVVNMKELI